MSFNARISITLHKSNAKQLCSFVNETLVRILTLIGNTSGKPSWDSRVCKIKPFPFVNCKRVCSIPGMILAMCFMDYNLFTFIISQQQRVRYHISLCRLSVSIVVFLLFTWQIKSTLTERRVCEARWNCTTMLSSLIKYAQHSDLIINNTPYTSHFSEGCFYSQQIEIFGAHTVYGIH